MENSAEKYSRLSTAPLAVSCETVRNSALEVLGELASAVLGYDGIMYIAVDSATMLKISRRQDLPLARGIPCEIQRFTTNLEEAFLLMQRELSAGR